MTLINIAKDYSKYPAGRFLKDGPFNGEKFRHKFLENPLRSNQKITIEMDGVRGYGSSFLEEAFGGLIRAGIPLADLERLLTLKATDPGVLAETWSYINDAAAKNANRKG